MITYPFELDEKNRVRNLVLLEMITLKMKDKQKNREFYFNLQ